MNKEIDRIVISLKDEMLQAASKLIQIRSVEDPSTSSSDKPFGKGVSEALEFTLQFGKNLGFQVKNVDGYAGHIEYGETGKLFAVLGHLDVVPEGTGWSVEPFGGIVKDGFLWGRGAVDDKGPTVAAIFALKAVQDSGLPISNRVRIILGTDEESGWKGITHYFEKQEAPEYAVTPDANFPIIYAEKGIISYKITTKRRAQCCGKVSVRELRAGTAPNVVPEDAHAKLEVRDNEVLQQIKRFSPGNKARVSFTVENDVVQVRVKGKSAHGSKPEHGINAAAALIDLLSQLDLNDKGLKEFVSILNSKIGYETDGKSLRISGTDCVAGPLTVNLGTVAMDETQLTAVVNIRYPVFYSDQMLSSQMKEALKPLLVQPMGHLKPLFVSPDSELIKILREVYIDVTGQEATLLTTGGGTYARAVPCGVAFGPVFPGREETEHQPDERISVDDLVLTARIYAQLIYRMLSR